jgi:hypothetical protein
VRAVVAQGIGPRKLAVVTATASTAAAAAAAAAAVAAVVVAAGTRAIAGVTTGGECAANTTTATTWTSGRNSSALASGLNNEKPGDVPEEVYVMPSNNRRKVLLIGLALIAVVGGAAVIAQTAKTKAEKPKVTLHEQTKKAGGKYVLKYKPDRGTVYPNVEELAKRSDMIVVGRILSHKANLTPDERFITQDFLVKVSEVIKGELPRGASLLLSLPGGTHRFADKTFAAMAPVGFKQPEDGGLYVLFLKARNKDSAFKGQRLVSEDQGLFALTNGTVAPADLTPDDPISVKYRKMSAASFLHEIHKAVPRKSNKEAK